MQFCSSYHLAGASPLPLDVGYLFLVGSNIFQSTVVQQQVGVLAGEDELRSLYFTIPLEDLGHILIDAQG